MGVCQSSNTVTSVHYSVRPDYRTLSPSTHLRVDQIKLVNQHKYDWTECHILNESHKVNLLVPKVYHPSSRAVQEIVI